MPSRPDLLAREAPKLAAFGEMRGCKVPNRSFQEAQWKARLTSMEELLDKVRALGDIAPETASMLIQSVSHVPGWSEKNFQVGVGLAKPWNLWRDWRWLALSSIRLDSPC